MKTPGKTSEISLPMMAVWVAIAANSVMAASPSLTIYNQNFAVVRDAIDLDLRAGVNQVSATGMTAYLEPGSVILRDPRGEHAFRILEQNHLYTLERPTTLLDAQKKQAEFVRAEGVKSKVLYTYDGADLIAYGDWRAREWNVDSTFGTAVNKKVSVTREFENNESNRLGLPLPRGRVRVYRRDAEGRLEFTGENEIDHTPRDETVRVNTGFAFDLVGDRKRTHINVHLGGGAAGLVIDPVTGAPVSVANPNQPPSEPFVDESFEITLRNRKEVSVEIRVIEHLYRGSNWVIQRPSDGFVKLDSRTIEYRVTLEPGEEKKVAYTVHYTWM